MMYKKLEKFGFDEWVRDISSEYIKDGSTLAKVIEVNRNSYTIDDGSREMPAQLSGKFMFDAKGGADFPTVGDWVAVQALNNYSLAIIHSLLPRKTVLKRKEPGRRTGFQLIASNIDYGLVVQSSDHINLNLLDRFLAMLNESGILPLVIISKIDLLSQSEPGEIENSLKKLKNQYQLISNITGDGIEELSKRLLPGKTYCLLGQSGVGKTSLLNSLLRKKSFKVNSVREKDGKGRHTTVSRQLIPLESGSIFIDTPGIRELGNFGIDEALDQTFEEISSYASKCRFRDCTHTHETGCAVMEALNNGGIEQNRYDNFIKLRKESEFYEMSYRQKRKKDKSFGKMVKNFKKSKRRN